MGVVLWFTGLSGSGKTTIAEGLSKEFEAQGKRACVLDGDVVRETLHTDLDFSREGIRENNRRVAELARERAEEYHFVLVPLISPYREDRKMARDIIGENFVEVYAECSLEECIKKDVKGLYKKALRGEIENFIGVSSENPYEPPENPEIVLDTVQKSAEECAEDVIRYLNESALL